MAPWRAEALKRGYASSLAIPLLIDSAAFGALTIYAAEPEAFGAEEVTLLTELADDMAFGITTLRTRIERARAEEEIRTLECRVGAACHCPHRRTPGSEHAQGRATRARTGGCCGTRGSP